VFFHWRKDVWEWNFLFLMSNVKVYGLLINFPNQRRIKEEMYLCFVNQPFLKNLQTKKRFNFNDLKLLAKIKKK